MPALTSPHEVRLLVTEPEAGDLVKARQPIAPRYPPALLTHLEGLALWRGQPLGVVIIAADPSRSWFGSGLFGDELWPEVPLHVTGEAGPIVENAERMHRTPMAVGHEHFAGANVRIEVPEAVHIGNFEAASLTR